MRLKQHSKIKRPVLTYTTPTDHRLTIHHGDFRTCPRCSLVKYCLKILHTSEALPCEKSNYLWEDPAFFDHNPDPATPCINPATPHSLRRQK